MSERPSASSSILVLALTALACGTSTEPRTAGHDEHAAHDEHAGHDEPAGHEGHDAHANHGNVSQTFARLEADYPLPEVTLVDQKGQPFAMKSLESSERPVALNFIFTTCTTICPVMTATFASAREQLGADADKVHMVSMSIDPQKDTPAVLTEYAKKFDAPPDWTFLTGEPSDILAILEAFDADFTTKTEHEPLTFLREPGAEKWVRLDGLGNATKLTSEIRTVLPGAK